MLVSNFMNNLNTNASKLDKLQSQLATNRKYAHMSDDPVSVIYSQQARYKLSRLADYHQNVSVSKGWLQQTESGLRELNDILTSAYEACVDASTDVKSATDKENAAKYIKQLRDQMLHTLNTAYGDKFIFGGYNTTGVTENRATTPPFTINADDKLCYNGIEINIASMAAGGALEDLHGDVLTFDVGIGIEMPVTFNGIDVVYMGTEEIMDADGNPTGTYRTKDIFSIMDQLYKDVLAGKPADEIAKNITDLQAGQQHILGLVAEVGGRDNRLDILISRYEQDDINYTQMKSDAEDADQAEVIMNYKMAEAVYKAALSAGAFIIQPTLMDFLR
jgi:flagellar hook-associated protein 3 FlgL